MDSGPLVHANNPTVREMQPRVQTLGDRSAPASTRNCFLTNRLSANIFAFS